MKRLLACLIASFCLTLVNAASAADAWPSRPIRLIVPAPPGGAADILARALAERLTAALRQQVIVDNRPGANGVIAVKTLMAAPADGYALLYSGASQTVLLAALKPDLGVDFTKDLVPVAPTVFGGSLLVVNPEVPAKNLKELIALIKAHPDDFAYATFGNGSNGHLTMEWLKARTGMRTQHVQYKGSAPMLTELMSGVVKVAWVDAVAPLPFIRSGKVRALATNGSGRTPQLPDVPTMGEQGYPFPGDGWQGVFAPKGTPPSVIERLNAEVNKIVSSSEMKELAVRLNVEARQPQTSEQFRALMVRDFEHWKKIVIDAQIKAD